jgi:hypothetical protein
MARFPACVDCAQGSRSAVACTRDGMLTNWVCSSSFFILSFSSLEEKEKKRREKKVEEEGKKSEKFLAAPRQ